jgi:homoserine kinase
MAVDSFLEATWASLDGTTGEEEDDPRGVGDSGGEAGPVLQVTLSGTMNGATWAQEDDLVVQVLRETYAGAPNPESPSGREKRGTQRLLRGRLHIHSEIPLGRGLGSSAAARVAGSVLGRLLARGRADRPDVLRDAAIREGHPDNAAPAVLGGLVAANRGADGRVVAVPLPLSLRIGWVFAMPGTGLATERARAALPEQIPFSAAIRNTGRLALLIPALAAGDGDLLARAMEDELHVPYRLPLIPGAREAVEAARAAGAWGVTLSGAGSGLLAAVPPGCEAEVGRAMARSFEAHPDAHGGSWRILRPWTAGAQWGFGPLRPRGPERFATSPA